MMASFLSDAMEAMRLQSNIFKVLKNRSVNLELILHKKIYQKRWNEDISDKEGLGTFTSYMFILSKLSENILQQNNQK